MSIIWDIQRFDNAKIEKKHQPMNLTFYSTVNMSNYSAIFETER